MGAYHRPSDLDTALLLLAETAARPLAGGTDLLPADATATAWGEPGLAGDDLLDLSGLAPLARIEARGAGVEIGAGVTWSDLADAGLPPAFAGLQQAARQIGGLQIQNRGSLAGNLCNASPAADGVPPLLALDAVVRLASRAGRRELPLESFILGNRRTARRPDELLTHILVPEPPAGARSTFLKLGARRYLVISIAMVAVTLATDEAGRLTDCRIAVGACSPVARRLTELEAYVLGLTTAEAAAAVTETDLASLAPIDDVRADADYRREAALVLVRRALAGHSLAPAA